MGYHPNFHLCWPHLGNHKTTHTPETQQASTLFELFSRGCEAKVPSPSLFPQPSQRKCQRGNGLAVVSLVLVHVRFGQNFLHLLTNTFGLVVGANPTRGGVFLQCQDQAFLGSGGEGGFLICPLLRNPAHVNLAPVHGSSMVRACRTYIYIYIHIYIYA